MGVSGDERARHDFYFRKAQKENFRARSVYKLQEIQNQHRVLRRGMVVVDLGAAPGSWAQFAAKVVGKEGRVFAIDRQEIKGDLPAHVRTFKLDLLDTGPAELRAALAIDHADVVISDMAPNTSGVRSMDHIRSIELCQMALEIGASLLGPGGSWVCKVFQGGELNEFIADVKGRFETVKRFKPKSSKSASVEIFLVAQGFKGRPAEEA